MTVLEPPPSVNAPDHRRRTTLALLTTGAIDPNNRAIWAGCAAAAQAAGVNLICYPGRLVDSPIEFEKQRNILYRWLDARTVDGLVLMGGLNAWLTLPQTYAFIDGLRPMPLVTTGIILEGVPGVTVDNYHAMHDVVTHMAETHQHRRIAFIRGQANHQEADDRYRAYLDVLREHYIPYDPDLVYQGNFKESGGVDGVNELLDGRGVRFEALVAASDNMAIGAMKALQSHGYRIPADVAVAGLNGEDQGLVISPPLTTAPLHFYEQAYQATQMVLALLSGEAVPPKVVLPARLMLRQSCGCLDPVVTHAQVIPHTEKLDSFTDEIVLLDQLVFGESGPHLQLPEDQQVQQVFPALLKHFLTESVGKTQDAFLDLFVQTIQQTANTNDAFPRWHEIISALRQFAISQRTDAETRLRIENLVQQARVVIGESARRHNAYQVLQADEKLHTLGEISQSLNITSTFAELTDTLERAQRLLNIAHGFLFLYPPQPVEAEAQARCVYGYINGRRLAEEQVGQVFPARLLLPAGMLERLPLTSLVVEPLFYRDDQLGYVVFAADPREEAVYEILGGQISAALRRAMLTERNVRLYNEALEARRLAEEANLLKSRFLSTVSHELRTPLALIVGTIEMMQQEEQAGVKPPLPEAARRDMDTIRTSSKHLFRLIGDVLDLASNQAGELRLNLEPLDLAGLLDEVALMGKAMARKRGLEWREQLPAHLPVIMGDRTRLRQVTINLLSNAAKFTERGFISLNVSINPGQVVVEISDSGLGIPPGEQNAIFDEFRRSERSVARGYGGMGLGLAISRRLVELHGGAITAHSNGQDGDGSTFTFTLPVLPNRQACDDPAAERRSAVLLLAEHAARSQALYRHLLSKGFTVEVLDVSEQPDWLAQVAACPPGAVVLDFQPAAERGWELMQMLKQNPDTRQTPVIFTNLAAQSGRGAVLEMDYLSKPLAPADLSQVLERLGLKRGQAEPAGAPRKTILLVDDDPKVLEMHARMLESLAPLRILRAYGGRQALELMQTETIDLVLLDLMMPDVDGFEVLRIMRLQEATRSLPVIVLSAQILTAHDMERLQQGVAAVLGKGLFSMSEVLAQVEGALAHSKRLGSAASRTVREAMAFIHERYAEPLTRSRIAAHVAITERYLTHCFRQELGVTPVTYLNRYRVTRARQMLEASDHTITEVALAVGFSDASYFNRVFRQEVGVTPSEWRRGTN